MSKKILIICFNALSFCLKTLILILIVITIDGKAQSSPTSKPVVIGLSERFSTINTLTSTVSDAAAERVQNLVFNSLVRKNENLELVGELAKEIKLSQDGKTITFTLQENVKFHNGKYLTSADVKYTFDELFKSNGYKSGAFFDVVDDKKVPHIVFIVTPDTKTVVFQIRYAALKNQLLSSLVAIPIIAEGTVEQQKNSLVGTGPYKLISFHQSQNIVDLKANTDYWEGAPQVQKLRIRTIVDADLMEAELRTGNVDIVPVSTILTPERLNSLAQQPELRVEKFAGSNIQYLGFNTQAPPLDNVKVRQAIGYAIDRERIVKDLFFGQATVAHSVLPQESWAYNAGTKYNYDPNKAKQLLKQAGYKNKPIKYKFYAGNALVNQYSQIIQKALNDIGLNVQLEPLEPNVLRTQLSQGQFQVNTGIWVNGNQEPQFLRDLFSTTKIPNVKTKVSCCNRSRYSNHLLDSILEQANNETDSLKAKELYFKAQEVISRDLPLLPLWYPANVVVSNKRIGNIKVSPSGDWSFVKDITSTY